MVIERLDHAADRVLHQLVVVDAVDVVLAHPLQHFGQQPRVGPRQRIAAAGVRGAGAPTPGSRSASTRSVTDRDTPSSRPSINARVRRARW